MNSDVLVCRSITSIKSKMHTHNTHFYMKCKNMHDAYDVKCLCYENIIEHIILRNIKLCIKLFFTEA